MVQGVRQACPTRVTDIAGDEEKEPGCKTSYKSLMMHRQLALCGTISKQQLSICAPFDNPVWPLQLMSICACDSEHPSARRYFPSGNLWQA
jgi:hypothetical protein